MEENLSQSEIKERQRRRLAKSADVLAKYFQRWILVCPNFPVRPETIAVYCEALDDLTPEQIEYGCMMATKEMEGWPQPGFIRSCAAGAPIREVEVLGPRLEWTAGEHSDYLKRWLRDQKKPAELPAPKEARKQIPHTEKSIEQQKQELKDKGYLQ